MRCVLMSAPGEAAARLSLIPFLAWVGLGADGLSSSAYGPEEAFRTLGAHTYLALALALISLSMLSMATSWFRTRSSGRRGARPARHWLKMIPSTARSIACATPPT